MDCYKFSILYVEDNQEVRESLKYFLTTLCDKYYTAGDGKEGLELYKKYLPNLVISDIKMPKMSGIEMAKEIKKINSEQHIIFTTAHSEINLFMKAIEMQIEAYVLKPIDFDKLKNGISKVKNQLLLKNRLKNREKLIKEIISLQDNILFILDNSYNIIFANRAFYEFFDISSIGEFKEKYHCFNKIAKFQDRDFSNSENWTDEFISIEASQRILKIKDVISDKERSFLTSIKKTSDENSIIFYLTEVTEIQEDKEEFKNKAFRDSLTNIYNRAYFDEEIKNSIYRFKRDQGEFAVIMFDIDFFKKINDSYGHQTGDKILKDLAKLVYEGIREGDVLARWGGEEFMIILSCVDIDSAQKVAEDLRKKIENYTFIDGIKVTCSFGVSFVKKSDSKEILIKRVDDALYEAKNSGRNRVVVR